MPTAQRGLLNRPRARPPVMRSKECSRKVCSSEQRVRSEGGRLRKALRCHEHLVLTVDQDNSRETGISTVVSKITVTTGACFIVHGSLCRLCGGHSRPSTPPHQQACSQDQARRAVQLHIAPTGFAAGAGYTLVLREAQQPWVPSATSFVIITSPKVQHYQDSTSW